MKEVETLRRLEDMDDEKQEEAMRLIAMAQQLKERKVAWVDKEAEIAQAGGASCLVCDSCRYKFSQYQAWSNTSVPSPSPPSRPPPSSG